MLFSSTNKNVRRFIAVATAGIALFAMAAGPALAAEGGYASISRPFKITGDRDRIAIVSKFTRSTPGSGLTLGVGFGKEGTDGSGSISVTFLQGGTTARSRAIKVDGYSGTYKAVQGQGCFYEYRLTCDRQGYDWVQGRAYKVSFVRGGKTAQGWLWTVSVRDQSSGKTTKLVSFRAPNDRLSTTAYNGAHLYSNFDDCTDIPVATAVVKKPAGAGSSTSWSAAQKYADCAGATTAAPIVKGSARLRVS